MSHNPLDQDPGPVEVTLAIPPGLRLALYRLTLEALQPLHLNNFKGSALRGGFGHTFKRLACLQSWPCDKYCQAGNQCAYGYIFETAPPEQSERLRSMDNIPRPFVLRAPADPRTTIPPGEQLAFELILIGRGIEYRQDFERVFQRLGQEGFGKSRGRYQLLAMKQVAEARGDQIAAIVATLPPGRITLDLLTPTRLTQAEKPVRQGPPFAVLVRTLLSRLSSLTYFHCGAKLELDFRGLIDQAEAVSIVEARTSWFERFRRSSRQQQDIPISGLVGQVTYAGALKPYLPLLALGEFIHLGKGTVFGNGQYRIVR